MKRTTRSPGLLRSLGRLLWLSFAVVCIGLAVLVGVARLLLPFAENYRSDVEDWLAERLAVPVSVAGLSAEWSPSGPVAHLRGLVIGDAANGQFSVDQADLGLDLISWVLNGRSGVGSLQFELEKISLIHDESTGWQLAGLDRRDGAEGNGRSMDWLRSQSLINVNVASLHIGDPGAGWNVELSDGEFTFNNHADHLHFSGEISDGAGGVIQLVAEADSSGDIEMYARAEAIDLATVSANIGHLPTFNTGQLQLELWGEYAPEKEAIAFRGPVKLESVLIASDESDPIQGQYRVQSITADIQGTADLHTGWSVDTPSLTVRRGEREFSAPLFIQRFPGRRYHAVASALPVRDIAEGMVFFPKVPTELRQYVAAASPMGTLASLDIRWSLGNQRPVVEGTVVATQASWQAVDHLPGASGVDIHSNYLGQRLTAEFSGRSIEISLPQVLASPVGNIDSAGQLLIDWQRPVMSVALERTVVRHDALSAHGDIVWRLDSGEPSVDMALEITRGDLSTIGPFTPVHWMSPELNEWLADAIVAGEIESASAVLAGDLDDWPFVNQEGEFQVTAAIQNATLNYQDQWPPLTNTNISLRSTGVSLSASSVAAQVGDMRGAVDLTVDNLDEPVVNLAVRTVGDIASVVQFLKSAPLPVAYKAPLAGLTIDGRARVRSNIRIPLDERENSVDGSVELTDVNIVDEKWGVAFANTKGNVQYSDAGFKTDQLETIYRGKPANLTITTGSHTEDPSVDALARLSGKSELSDLLVQYPQWQTVARFVRGPVPWTTTIEMAQSGPTLRLESQLADAEVNLPDPIGKARGEPASLQIEMGLGPDSNLTVEFENRLALISGDAAKRMAITFGSSDLPVLPDEGIRITGSVDSLEGDGWLKLLEKSTSESTDTSLPVDVPVAVDLTIDELDLFSRTFKPLRLQIQGPDADNDWVGTVQGEQTAGTLRWAPGLPGLLTGQMSRLHLPEAHQLESSEPPTAHPEGFPRIDLLVGDFRVGEAKLGQMRLEARPTVDGLKIDQFETESADIQISARGLWTASNTSELEVTLTAENLGTALEQFGFEGIVDEGQLLAALDGQWPGGPGQFDLSSVTGNLVLSVGRGRISEVDPGAGRVFGLLSFQALPRRLALDFSDLFDDGFAFDRITGTFRFADGSAITDDLTIEAPTAHVHIVGSTDLVDRQYDQFIVVNPQVGETLPLVGAIAGGGVGAAAALLLRGVFNNQLEKMIKYRYAVVGSWADPEVTRLRRNDLRDVDEQSDQSDQADPNDPSLIDDNR